MTRLLVGSATDVGLVRANNQDQLLVVPGLYAVADGMGGHAAGEVASATAVSALQAAFDAGDQRSAEALQGAAQAANRAVWEQARANRRMLGMGTTLVALAVVERPDGTGGLAVAHIGDSRVYLFRDDTLRQLTVDHSLVQELVDEGQISPDQAAVHPQRHVLTRALGVEPAAAVDLIELVPQQGDRYILCSDGLSREASDDQIAAVLRRFDDPNDVARELVALANSAGGSDNVTVVVVDVVASEGGTSSAGLSPYPARAAQPDDGGGAMGTGALGGLGSSMAPSTALATLPEQSDPRQSGSESSGRPERAGAAPFQPVPAAPQRTGGPSRVTWRVVGFFAAVLVVVGGALACLAWYARSSYFVTISAGRISVFQGRPGGVLWFEPTLALRTQYTTSSVEAHWLATLQAGQLEPSLSRAQQYIDQMVSEKREAEAVVPPSAKGPPRSQPSTTPAASRPQAADAGLKARGKGKPLAPGAPT